MFAVSVRNLWKKNPGHPLSANTKQESWTPTVFSEWSPGHPLSANTGEPWTPTVCKHKSKNPGHPPFSAKGNRGHTLFCRKALDTHRLPQNVQLWATASLKSGGSRTSVTKYPQLHHIRQSVLEVGIDGCGCVVADAVIILVARDHCQVEDPDATSSQCGWQSISDLWY